MAKKVIITDRVTGEEEYPVTTTDCVYCSDGSTIKEKYATKQYTQDTVTEFVNSTPERIAVIDALEEKLTEDNIVTTVINTIGDAKKQLFIDQWKILVGKQGGYYPEEEKPFLLNEVYLTYEEALELASYGNPKNLSDTRLNGLSTIRTNLPYLIINPDYGDGYSSVCNGLNSIEVFLSGVKTGTSTIYFGANSFCNCPNLRKIVGAIRTGNKAGSSFVNCPKLEDIGHFTYYGKANLNLKDCPLLKYKVFNNLHTTLTTTNTNHMTLTVHPSIYAAMIGEAPEYPFNDGTQEEWSQLLETYSSKNITIATV